jgi:ParB family chromosome partitioning protein
MRSALGKGLDALISEDTVASLESDRTVVKDLTPTSLPINKITPNPNQPRRQFSSEAMDELAASIKERGVLQPILVTPTSDGTYEIIAGERRWRAAQKAGLTEVPVLIKTGSETDRFEIALVENIQREDLNPIEQAKAYSRLQNEFHLTQEAIAQAIGKDRAVVANTLRLLNLSEDMQQTLSEGKISAGHGRALAALEDPAARDALFKRILTEDLPVRAVEHAVRAQKKVPVREHLRSAGYESKPAEVKAIEEDLQRVLARKVELQTSGASAQKGWLKLEFYSLDDLDHLIEQLKKSV